ncbi:metallophosphoesterase [Pseudonocardia humida]|uniref:Metallophosphoesterase n=1 Tax=Pseudonocardia humida TaxID=2800819 RepID=A0ABT1A681_9PSEU|nr:metallophosphoesterase [Pseudonocardia humida]MCO1658522.1 metallophosphoesterase [Pseudonocardia humida]
MTVPPTTLIVITDVHLPGPDGADAADRPDAAANLRLALDAVAAAAPEAAALVFAGDLAADGHPHAYRALRAAVAPVSASLAAPPIWVMGNHDERAPFRAELLDDGRDPTAPCDSVHRTGGLRVAVLDSTVPGHHHGELDDAQLDRLAVELAEPTPDGTVLVLHHPPVRSPVGSVDLLRLHRPERLAAVIAGSDVRMVVCGHAHYAGAGALAGIPVWVAPATWYRTDALPPAGTLRAARGPSVSRVDLLDGSAVATAIPLGGEPVYQVDAAARLAWMRERVAVPG